MTTVNFDPDKKRIEDIFEGSFQLVIPRYQRTYAWPLEKVEEFYSDFIEESEKAEDNLAFLGTILFAISDNGTLEVIDGQQRLITITIFLAALRDILAKNIQTTDAVVAADKIQNKIEISSTFGSSYSDLEPNRFKLQVGVEIETIFHALIYRTCDDVRKIKPSNSAERKVFDAYSFFRRKLLDIFDRPGLHPDQKIKLASRTLSKINSIEYIDIRVTNKEVAYNLFESHNAKGVALAKTDLIKNYYFGRLGGSDAEKNKRMDAWDDLMNQLIAGTSNMLPDRFFYYMLESYEGNFSSSSLYRRVKPHMQDHQLFFKNLKMNAQLMIMLKNSDTGNRSVDTSLVALNEKLKVNQCFILLLCMFRNREKLSSSIYERIVLMIEDFTYIYSGISKLPSNALEKIYSKQAKKLEEDVSELSKDLSAIDKERVTGRLYKSLKTDLQEIIPSYSVFLESFKTLDYSNSSSKVMIRYTFQKIERQYSKGIVELSDTFTLDHIVPQKKAIGVLTHCIGNLVPMSGPDNSAKGSTDASEQTYAPNENFYSIKSLREQLGRNANFGEEAIEERMSYLSKYAYDEAFAHATK